MPSGLKNRGCFRGAEVEMPQPGGAGCGTHLFAALRAFGSSLHSQTALGNSIVCHLTHSKQIDSLVRKGAFAVKTEISIEYCVV